jgi:hypothetical protein
MDITAEDLSRGRATLRSSVPIIGSHIGPLAMMVSRN